MQQIVTFSQNRNIVSNKLSNRKAPRQQGTRCVHLPPWPGGPLWAGLRYLRWTWQWSSVGKRRGGTFHVSAKQGIVSTASGPTSGIWSTHVHTPCPKYTHLAHVLLIRDWYYLPTHVPTPKHLCCSLNKLCWGEKGINCWTIWLLNFISSCQCQFSWGPRLEQQLVLCLQTLKKDFYYTMLIKLFAWILSQLLSSNKMTQIFAPNAFNRALVRKAGSNFLRQLRKHQQRALL